MSFADRVAAFTQRAEQAARDIHRSVSIELFSAIVRDTPVDRGDLRGSWQVTVGSPPSSDAIGDPMSAITATVPDGWGGQLYLSNLKPYAHRIEYDGWSHTKAPEGMVRRNTANIPAMIRNAARGVGS